jgi:hypothetical protein
MKTMPPLARSFIDEVDNSLAIVASTEVLWLRAPPGSEVRRQLKVDRLEALYESSFLRIFCAWENFLEEALTRFMARYETSAYSPVPAAGKTLPSTLVAARQQLYGTRSYLLWHDPGRVAHRSADHTVGCPVETVVTGASMRLLDFAAIRHRVAHSSLDARVKFGAAARSIAGSDFKGRPGRLLRSADVSDPLNQAKWIRVIADELVDLAGMIVPD